MSKKKLILIITLAILIPCIASVSIFLGVYIFLFNKNTQFNNNFWENKFSNDKVIFEGVKDDFVEIKEYQQFDLIKLENGCSVIRKDSQCDYIASGESGSYERFKSTTGIAKTLFDNNLISIERDGISCNELNDTSCIEINVYCGDFGSCGFRYSESGNDLKADSEFIYVKKLDNNWTLFNRDWN